MPDEDTIPQYIITYDITSDNRRDDVREYIHDTYDVVVELESSYVVETSKSARRIMSGLKSNLRTNDKMFVAGVAIKNRATYP